MENLTLEELCVHQVCIWKKSSFRESLECMARNGVFKTAVWKPLLDETELKSAKQNLIDSGVKAISMCPLVLLDEDAYPDPDGRLSCHRRSWKMLQSWVLKAWWSSPADCPPAVGT